MNPVYCSIGYGRETIPYEVRFVARRRTLGIEVHPDMHVLVRAPDGIAMRTIEERVKRRVRWISKQLNHFHRFSPRTPPRHYVSGETHLYLGRQYRLKAISGDENRVKVTRGVLSVSCRDGAGPERVKRILQKWYLERAKDVFAEVLDSRAHSFSARGHRLPILAVRTMQKRWGSLSGKRLMTLNSNLVRAPRTCIEYVIVHELCHLKHKDHSAAFYRLLEQVMPDWRRRKQRLEEALL
jgi:hypothetical protein